MTNEEYKTFLFELSDKLEQIVSSYEAYAYLLDGISSNGSIPKDFSGLCFLLGSVTKDLRTNIESIVNIKD